MTLLIRKLQPTDRAAWEPLWQGYLTFYKRALRPEVTEKTWSRFFDTAEPVHALVAEGQGRLVGLVHYLFHRSTWMIEPACYLSDLFTSEAARGQGVGRALIEAVAAQARAAGAGSLYWLTHETNTTARTLYDKLAERSGFIQYRKPL